MAFEFFSFMFILNTGLFKIRMNIFVNRATRARGRSAFSRPALHT